LSYYFRIKGKDTHLIAINDNIKGKNDMNIFHVKKIYKLVAVCPA